MRHVFEGVGWDWPAAAQAGYRTGRVQRLTITLSADTLQFDSNEVEKGEAAKS